MVPSVNLNEKLIPSKTFQGIQVDEEEIRGYSS
jgi:hypothetical protein